MTSDPFVPPEQAELHRIIGQTRRRWRAKIALRGAAIVCGGVLLTLLLSAYMLEGLRFSPAAILGFRIVIVAATAALAAWFLVRPLLRRVTDEQVALYLEEHHPSLEATLLSAVDASGTESAARQQQSRVLVRKLVGEAIDRCQSVDAAGGSERTPLRAYSGALVAVLGIATLALLLGPTYLRQAASALLRLSQDVEAASPYRIDVEPGSARVPRGADQTITARLSGFTADDATLMARAANAAGFERQPMIRTDDGGFELMLFDLDAEMEYFVEAAGVRSPRFSLSVVDLPYVRRLALEYRFPAHSGLPPETIEDGGDVAALTGTVVHVRAFTTIPAAGGRILLDDGRAMPLAPQADGTLTGEFTIERDGFYSIQLDTANGEKVAASPQYTVDALADRPPSVTFTKPRRDVTATPVQEVFVEARAADDFGVRNLELVYSVNGGAEKTLSLYRGASEPAKEIAAGHTFYLEEFGVQPGDFVSYHARVRDNDAVGAAKVATSDLYFIRVRPFGKEFRPAESQAGGGGGAGDPAGGLSEQQRQIVTGTFNLLRDQKTLSADRLRESAVVLALSQGKLRERVSELASRMEQRLLGTQPEFGDVAQLLPEAAKEMKAAEEHLQARNLQAALAPEQRALRLLQKAEEQYEMQVTMNRNAGGGGGGGGNSGLSEELADLFAMELDKRANQYETRDRAEQQNSSAQLDEIAEKLRELARRQEQEAERQRHRAAAGQGSSSGSSAGGQRALADQVEEAARRLERLAREEARPELSDAARQLQQAADAMRRSAANGESGQAGSALERLREAQDRLARDRESHAERTLQEAVREADELAREQQELAGEVGAFAGERVRRRQDDAQRLGARKDDLESRVAGLERRLDGTANELQRSEREAAEKLREAAGGIRNDRLKEKIRFSKEVMRRGTPEQSEAFENEISANLESLRERLHEAAGAFGQSQTASRDDTLDKARELARGLESLDRRWQDEVERERQQRSADRGDQPGADQQGREQSGREPGERGEPAGGDQQGGEQAGDQSADAGQPSPNQGQGDQQGGGTPSTAGSPRGRFGGTPSGGGFTGDARRQFRNEVRRWSAEAQDLERQLRGHEVDTHELQEVLRGLRALDREGVFNSPNELERLRSAVAENAKRFEFRLRRGQDGPAAPASLSSSDDVPEGFRPLVEEYYRSLARRPAQQ
jgi:hypothetical protein